MVTTTVEFEVLEDEKVNLLTLQVNNSGKIELKDKTITLKNVPEEINTPTPSNPPTVIPQENPKQQTKVVNTGVK